MLFSSHGAFRQMTVTGLLIWDHFKSRVHCIHCHWHVQTTHNLVLNWCFPFSAYHKYFGGVWFVKFQQIRADTNNHDVWSFDNSDISLPYRWFVGNEQEPSHACLMKQGGMALLILTPMIQDRISRCLRFLKCFLCWKPNSI